MLKLKLIILFFIFYNSFKTYGQSIVFNEIYDYGLNFYEAVDAIMEIDSTNNFIILSQHLNLLVPNNNSGLRIFVVDEYGNIEEDSFIKNSSVIIGSGIEIVKENYYVTSVFEDSLENYRWDKLFIKLDKNLDTVYSKIIDIGYNDGGGQLNIIGINKFMLLSYYYADSSILENSQIVMVTIDTLGNVLDTWEYGGPGYDFAYDYEITDDGGFLIAGKTNDFVGDDFDYFVRKIDSTGLTEWYHEYGTTNDENVRTWNYLEPMQDGGYLIAGEERVSTVSTEVVAQLLKIDSLGVIEWKKNYSHASKFTNSKSIRINKDQTIILAGGTSDPDTIPIFNYPRGYLMKLSADGQTEIWRRYFSKFWNANDDYVHDMILTSDGGIMVSGYVISVPTTNNDAWLVKFDSCGYTVSDIPEPMLIIDSIVQIEDGNRVYITDQSTNYCTAELDWGDGSEPEDYYAYENNLPLAEKQFSHTYTQTGDFTIKTTALAGEEFRDYEVQILGLSNENVISTQAEISLFPNPANEYIVVQIPNHSNSYGNDGLVMNIQTLNGKQIKSINLNHKLYQQKINISSLNNGVYFVKFTIDGELFGTEKLVIAR